METFRLENELARWVIDVRLNATAWKRVTGSRVAATHWEVVEIRTGDDRVTLIVKTA
jgi:hypothetical protein